jgi:hypothetical protein
VTRRRNSGTPILRSPCGTIKNRFPRSVSSGSLALEEELIGTPANRTEQVLNRSEFDDGLEVFENSGATRRDRTGDLLITNRAYLGGS